MLSTTEWVILAAAVIVLVFTAALMLFMARTSRRRHAELKARFGPEYERAIEQRGSVARAERELRTREKRVLKKQLRPLSEGERSRFSADWHAVQARFVDDPSGAVQAADELIRAVMTLQGYDVDDFEQRVADLSVEHAGAVQHYRAAHDLAETNRAGRADTEQLRQATVHYRALFADLLVPSTTEGPAPTPLPAQYPASPRGHEAR